MVNINRLEKDLKERMGELSLEEVEGVIDNLVKEFYKAYYKYDVEKMSLLNQKLGDTLDTLKPKYNNIVAYANWRKLFYASNMDVKKNRELLLCDLEADFKSFCLITQQIAKNCFQLLNVLNTYFFNHNNDKDLMARLDSLIAMIRDNILDLIKLGEKDTPKYTKEIVEVLISSHREFIHEIISTSKFSFMKELGGVDVELLIIKLFNNWFMVQKEYEKIKEIIDDLFMENHGFKSVIQHIECDLGDTPKERLDEVLLEYPQYDIMSTKYTPKK